MPPAGRWKPPLGFRTLSEPTMILAASGREDAPHGLSSAGSRAHRGWGVALAGQHVCTHGCQDQEHLERGGGDRRRALAIEPLRAPASAEGHPRRNRLEKRGPSPPPLP